MIKDIFKFLNQNAGAIQAVATVVLAVITWCYVVLTNKLVKTAIEELELQRESARAKKRLLLSILNMLKNFLAQLPGDRQKGEQIRNVAVWEEAEVDNFQRLASDFDLVAGQLAAVVKGSLRWLKGCIVEVKNTSPSLGVNWEKFQWGKWNSELAKAKENIEKIYRALAGDLTDSRIAQK